MDICYPGLAAPAVGGVSLYPNGMKIIALIVAFSTLCAPLYAEPVPAPNAPEAPAEKPKQTCVCDQYGFKPLTAKAVAVNEYWAARRKAKAAGVIGGLGVLFSVIARSEQGLRESTQAYDDARHEMWAAKNKAVSLGALVVRGDDLDGGDIEIKLTKGVDYTIEKN